ncbi:MAG: CoA activase [bacterium]|nr:CoA activase [bacterium]
MTGQKSGKNTIGVDIGSISIAIAEIGADKKVINSGYSFHEGNIKENLVELLEGFNLSECGSIAVTSSTPGIIKDCFTYDTRVSFIKAAKHFYNDIGALLMVGGEKFGLALFDENGDYLNYKSNSSCAAGTGSFLDQQAKRLNLRGIEDFCEIACNNTGDIPKIASRCAVFAKTDLIHAQQEGYSLEEICDGLSHGLAKNIVDTLFSGDFPDSPLVFAGGVSRNESVVNHIASMLNTSIIVDELSHLYGAIGAALNHIDEGCAQDDIFLSPAEMILSGDKQRSYHYEPLELKLSEYPEFDSFEKYEYKSERFPRATPVEIDIYENLDHTGKNIPVYMGIDIGSTSTKAILVRGNEEVLAGLYTRTSGRPLEAVQTIFESLNDIAKKNNISFSFQGVGTTGSGRKFIGKIIGADIALNEITAHARAAFMLDSDVDTIIEIGGQDAKFTTMKNGMVTFSIMNNVCAAGTGSFVEEQAKKLACPLDKYSELAEGASAPLSSDRCTVFMERDLNYYMSEDYHVREVLASVLHSVRENYLTKVAIEKNIGDKIFFQGATAKNKALVAAFEQRLGKPIIVSKYCHLTGALGVALTLFDQETPSLFRGIDLYKKEIPLRNEVCELCVNHCKIKIAEVEHETVAFGFLCGRDYETKKFVNLNLSNFDLLKERKKVFAVPSLQAEAYDFTVGLPAALHLVEELSLWKHFFNLLSIKTISSENYSGSVKDGKKIAGAEFCAPISSIYGHVDYLSHKADYVFLPAYLELKQKEKGVRRHYCYYTQYASSIISSVDSINDRTTILSPVVRSIASGFGMKVQLYKMLKSMTTGAGKKISFMRVSQAYDKAFEQFNASGAKLKDIYTSESAATDDIKVVLLGRPYTILSRSMNSGIPDIFGRQGVKAFYQDMLSYEDADTDAIKPLLQAFHWNYASKIAEAAMVVAQRDGVYPVFVTSFKCTPDAFAIEYFKNILDSYNKPYLILQLDEHDSSVGYETRIEAGIRSFRNHFTALKASESAPRKPACLFKNPEVANNPESFNGKTLLLPPWDRILGKLLEAALQKEGIDARLLEESTDSIQRSLSLNTGQCLPLTIIAQNTIDYVEKYKLDPAKTVQWNINSQIACNLGMFPYYTKQIFETYGKGMEKITAFAGEIVFHDISIKTSINIYFAYMFSGLLRKAACKIRPYENVKGTTDAVIEESLDILYDTFLCDKPKEAALEKVIGLLENVAVTKTSRPRVAVFGDLYARDNDIMNQNLVGTIEDNGGEVITTPYSEYMKIIADPYIKRWLKEGLYSDAATAKLLQTTVPMLEKKYFKYFDRILQEGSHKANPSPEKILSLLNVKIENSGESMENVLKIYSLINNYPDISLFVQTNPSYCCPSLVTEAMSDKIEELTGIPVVTIEYDGTGGLKNDDIIPYLKYPRKSRRLEEKAV